MAENTVIIALSFIVSVVISAATQTLEGYVVNGDLAKISDFPHSGFLFIECDASRNKQISFYACGSSILNQAIVLTAAHCLNHCAVKFSFVTVFVGNSDKMNGLPYIVSNFKIHEKYDTRKKCNDIGLLKLKKPIEFGKNVRRVALMRNPPHDKIAQIAGWGLVKNDDPRTTSDFLMKASQKVWSRRSCIKVMGFIPEGTICGGTLDAHSYVARGDSGSGLMVRKYIQIGIVSYGIPSKSRGLTIYTDVAHFYNWIKKTANRLYCCKH